jgi:AraC family transcriptional regulator
LAKIALELERALAQRAIDGSRGSAVGRLIAQGDGWIVRDVVCTSGPDDHPFEEQHESVLIAIVVAGTFHYRSAAGRDLMTAGSLLLGNCSSTYECGHDHAAGDRCIAFHYAPHYFERVVSAKPLFRLVRLPPLRPFSRLVARACAGLTGSAPVSWEELGIELATLAFDHSSGDSVRSRSVPASSVARVTRVVREIEDHSDRPLDLRTFARDSGLSPYHFLRTFERVTGVTPHQYLLRTRLREAAFRLAEPAKIIDVALDSGFGDVSNFNRSFRAEFGTSPRAYRRQGKIGQR